MVGLLHTMAFMMLLLVGWVIWNNKPLTIDVHNFSDNTPKFKLQIFPQFAVDFMTVVEAIR